MLIMPDTQFPQIKPVQVTVKNLKIKFLWEITGDENRIFGKEDIGIFGYPTSSFPILQPVQFARNRTN